MQEKFRQECQNTALEAARIQKELDASLQSMADLETKLFHARRLLEMESKARREAEYERDQMEKKIVAVADLLQHERNLKDETKDKLAFLNTLPRKRKSLNPHLEEKYGNDINSTGSFLSDLSITQSEDDFLDVHHSKNWQKHRPSLPKNQVPCVGGKRSRLSGGTGSQMPIGNHSTPPAPPRRRSNRRSGLATQQQSIDIAPGAERICATTKVTIPQDGNGPIRTESTIESLPIVSANQQDVNMEELEPAVERIGDAATISTPRRCSAYKEASAPPLTPAINKTAKAASFLGGSPSVQASVRPNMMRQHNFATKTFIRADTCNQCQKK